jgi:beta-lactam-binding protein with PASTA domain
MRLILIIYSVFIIVVAAAVSMLVLKLNVRRPFFIIGMILLLVASPMLISYLAMSYYAPVPETIVPDLIGLRENEAQAKLIEQNLALKIEARYEEAGTISYQRPEAGMTVKEGRVISVIIGKPKTVEPTPVTTPEAQTTPPAIAPEPVIEKEVETETTEDTEEIIIYEETTEEGITE